MTENMKAFCQALSEDEELGREFKELLENLRASRREAVLGFAESHGLALTEEDFAPEPAEGEMSEDELTLVVGGFDDSDDCHIAAASDQYFLKWL